MLHQQLWRGCRCSPTLQHDGDSVGVGQGGGSSEGDSAHAQRDSGPQWDAVRGDEKDGACARSILHLLRAQAAAAEAFPAQKQDGGVYQVELH